MWFKNIQVYQFTEAFDFSVERLEAAMSENAFRPCPSIMPMSTGWIAPIGSDDNAPLIHQANGYLLFTLKVEEKIIPATVVRDNLMAKIESLEMLQSRKLSSKEKLALKDEVYSSMLPRAFSKNNTINAFFDPANNRLVIDAGSRNKAEEFVTFLRKTLGSLPVALAHTKPPALIMTHWLKHHKLPANFSFADSCVLYDAKDEGSTVRCAKHDLLSPNIHAFLKDGMEVVQLQLHWKDHLRFQLKDDLSITSIKFTDAIHDLAKDAYTENPEQEQDTNFVIMSKTVSEFLADLLPLFRD